MTRRVISQYAGGFVVGVLTVAVVGLRFELSHGEALVLGGLRAGIVGFGVAMVRDRLGGSGLRASIRRVVGR